jgi:aryl-phospho-beta-D-glucosidase BglC (GH1 family)
MGKMKNLLSLVFLAGLILTVFAKSANAQTTSYLHTNGRDIVDSSNKPYIIQGVNWFGLETGTFAPHGLWARNYKDMMRQIKSLGYNTIRFPYSNQALDPSSKPESINYDLNPELKNLTPIQLMDEVVKYAGELGLKVILDRHRPDASGQSALWYTGAYPEERWISDWKMLASRYKNNPTVVGVDLHNEPRGESCWGCGNAATDWKLASEKAGNAILSVNPNLLIIVEGIEVYDNQWYWWGGNLMGVKNNRVKLSMPNQLVYSTHDYPASLYNHSWFNDGNYPSNLNAVWDKMWGYIAKENIAPLLVGEFGTKLENSKDPQWFDTIIKYISDNNLSWTYWSWNPNSGDTGGILMDDWNTVQESKQSKIKTLINRTGFSGINKTVNAQPTVTSAPVATTPASTPLSSTAPVVTNAQLDIWWPTNGAHVSGTQPFKALIQTLTITEYKMFWQVDGGQLNEMANSTEAYPHKEANVDLSGWKWRGTGPYKVEFIAKDNAGKEISRATSEIFIP